MLPLFKKKTLLPDHKPVRTICTIGPTSESPTIIEQLVLAGMDIARVNMSHATYDQLISIKSTIDQLNIVHGKNVKILLDLQGPRMRVGQMPEAGIDLAEGQTVVFTTDPTIADAIHINDPYLHEDIMPNHPLFLANGDLELQVERTEGKKIFAKVMRGGVLHSRKGVNVPETNLTTRGLTEKDIEDAQFGLNTGVDYIAMSFVKDAKDIEDLKGLIGTNPVKTVAKIEIKLALRQINEIIAACDVIMVARGDLGIELPLEELPLVQKALVARTAKLGKQSIVATQMLMSMVDHPRPTRAEVSDVANAVLDGADMLMLSDETAYGNYPVEALTYLVKTIKHVETYRYTQLL